MSAPLVSHPVAIFLIVLVIILMAPLLLTRLKIPHIIGMIVAGVVVGPYGFNILADDSSFQIFGQVGLLYLMFLAGLEIDMYHLKLNLRRGLVFGLLTLLVPMVMGTFASVYILHIDWLTSILLASMYASHTLISYPIVTRLGITRSPAVLISIVGTIIAVIGALLVLGAAVNIHTVGSFRMSEFGLLLLRMCVYCGGVLYLYPRLARYFFKHFADNVTQWVFVMALVFLSALLAKLIGLEAVLGAFFAGLVLNRYIPSSSTLMSRIEFVGNALFIPYFLIGVGMMINIRVIGNLDTLWVTAVMLAVALSSKWIAAAVARRIYKMSGADRDMMFGLTTAHTAVALAVVTIGYNMTGPDGVHLMDETILNGTILVILITCAIAPVVTTIAAKRIKVAMLADEAYYEDPARKAHRHSSHTLVAVSNPLTASSLVDLALMCRPEGFSAHDSIAAINVRNDNSARARAASSHVLDISVKAAAAAGCQLPVIERFDLNVVTGLVNTIEERLINGIYIGMHRKNALVDSLMGDVVDLLLKSTNRMVVVSRNYIPLNTLTRIIVFVPPKAHYETGFTRWLHTVANLAREVGCRITFCCPEATRAAIAAVLRRDRYNIRSEYRDVRSHDDFLLLAGRVADDDLLVLVTSRPAAVSHYAELSELPTFLQRNFERNNLMLIYPEQFGENTPMESFADPLSTDISSAPSPWLVRLRSLWARRKALLARLRK